MIKTIPETLPFHKKLADFFQREEKDLWNWFSGDEFTKAAFDEQRLYLLKNTYRLEREKHANLFILAESVAQDLGIQVPVTLFQMMDGQQRNAGLIFQPDQVQITFSGDMLSALSEPEMRFTLGHEMAHFVHQTSDNGRYQTADRLLDWICGEAGAAASYGQSFRLARLYQEIYSDRIGLFCSDDLHASISTLVRISSGLTDVSTKAYLEQADEALSLPGPLGSAEYTHPETFVRARALADWFEDNETADEKLYNLVEGAPELERLDVIGQTALSGATRRFIAAFVNKSWKDSETLEAHAQGFFYDFKYNETLQASEAEYEALKTLLLPLSSSLKDYFSFLLLDFVTVDSSLEDAPLMEAARFSERIGLTENFDTHLNKELKLTKEQISTLREASKQDVLS